MAKAGEGGSVSRAMPISQQKASLLAHTLPGRKRRRSGRTPKTPEPHCHICRKPGSGASLMT